MKFVKYLLTAFTAIVLITACQKELDFITDGLAHGSLKSDATGDCLPSTVNGIYKADSLLNNTNFVDIQVDLTSVGTYDIKSDTVNGYSFSGSGTLGLTGVNSIRLYATGKPLLAGTDVFTIKFDSTTCFVNINVIGAGTGVAVFTLGGSPNTCAFVLNGVYTQGAALDVNNTVSLNVNVTDTGIYSITCATVNGMTFSAAGVFTSMGVQSLTLNGAGTPLTPGTSTIIVTSPSSTCSFDVTVLPSGTGGPAVYTLDATGGACSGASYSGVFAVGVALTTAEAVLINATVTTAGTYTVTTNTVNGMTFTGSGTFASTGPQPVVLVGSGTPTASGIYNFTATAGTSTCTFSVTVEVSNLDYVPETSFSNWTARLVGGTAADTTYTQVNPNPIVINTNTYRIFESKVLGVATDSFYMRKNGGLYYELFNSSYGFDNAFNVDGLILDSNLAVNATWIINLGSNTMGGIPATGKINCTILEKGVTATIAGNTYTNIIRVKQLYSFNIGAGDVNSLQEEIWYAKGRGIVYYSAMDLPAGTPIATETTRIQIF